MPTINGTVGDDTLNGTSGDDTINGFDGSDTIDGLDGNDTIDGGPGRDYIHGGNGDDVIHAGSSDNFIFPEYIWDGPGNDIVYGEGDQDVIYGSPGNDYYDGGTGGAYQPFEGDAVVYADAAAGIDVDMRLASNQVQSAAAGDAANIGVDTLVNIEGITGSAFNDIMTANDNGMGFNGGAGDDQLNGGAGWDSLYGNDGNDTLIGGAGDDLLTGGDGNDSLDGGSGNDTLDGGNGSDAITDGAGSDQVYGGAGIDTVYASPGAGNDVYDGGDGDSDIVDYGSALAGVMVDLSAASDQARSVGSADEAAIGIDQLVNIEGVYGSQFDDVLTGNGVANRLSGRAGNDQLHGGAGDDILNGGEGNDLIDGGDGEDIAFYSSAVTGIQVSLATSSAQDTGQGVDTLISIEDLQGSKYDDQLTGNAASNYLFGWDGNDTLNGGAFNQFDGDIMVGGAGDDTYVVDSAYDQVQEYAGEGTDTIVSWVAGTYALGDNVENLKLGGTLIIVDSAMR